MSQTQIRGSSQIMPNSVTSGQVDTSIIVAAGSNAFGAAQSMGGFNLTNVGSPVNPNDATNKAYVDGVIQGLNQKPSARVIAAGPLAACTYANGSSGVGATLTGNANNTQTSIDGVTYALGDNILVAGQASAFQNGLYVVTQLPTSGVPFIYTRNVDMDVAADFSSSFVPVVSGTVYAGSLWLAGYVSTFVVGTTNVTFVQLNAATAYTGSGGIVVTGTNITVTYGTSANTALQGNDPSTTNARTPIGTTLSSGNVYVGSSGNVAASVALSGDVTITNAGVATVANQVKLSKVVTRETPSGTINGSNVTFTLANTPVSGTESLYLNGLLQDATNDYTISSGTITMIVAPISGDRIRSNYIST